jgi:hypothetical protein
VGLHPVAGFRVHRALKRTAEGAHEGWHIPARVDLAHAHREVGRRADPVRDHGENAGRHGLIDNEAQFSVSLGKTMMSAA